MAQDPTAVLQNLVLQLLRQVAIIEAKLDTFIQKEETEMAALDDAIATLTADVTAETTVNQSAVTLISSFPGLITAAVNAALAAGANPAQLTSITNLAAQIASNSQNLAAAVTANTPAASPAA